METVAAVVVCVLLGGLAVLQTGLAAGAPWGRLAWGGRHERLPTGLRVGSAVSVVAYGVAALAVLDRAQLVTVLPGQVSRVGTWVLVGYLALGVVMNAVSRSRPERFVMVPVCVVLALACGVVASARVGVPGDGPWVIGLSMPRGSWHDCFDDDAIAEGLMTADLPSSHASATLAADATADDVRRIVDCLDRALSSGTVTITDQR